MARRSVVGQLNMFDFWDNLTPPEDGGQVQMVSLIPEDADIHEETATPNASEEAEVSEETEEPEESETLEESHEMERNQSVMHKEVLNEDGTIKAEVSYYNYNKVMVRRPNEEPEWRLFDNSKDAVDFYIDEMLKL